ncbi:MAG: cytochrome c biogenesis protein ResB [Kiritimatiellaeota bacterium]|nr:cytochrome c biogenesis protein ResB [Kiritimatiellota bacterium]
MSSGTPAKRILKAIGSVWFAVVLLLLLMVAMGSATVYETLHGTEQARGAFYYATWFRLLLIFFGFNASAAIALRFPFRKRQLAFLLTHGGLLVILVGALVSELFGVEGRIVLAKGQPKDSFAVPGEILTLMPAEGPAATLDFGRYLGNGLSAVELPARARLDVDGVRIQVVRYLPDVAWKREILNDGKSARLAVEVSLSSADGENSTWLFAGEHRILGGKTVDLQTVNSPAEWQQLVSGKTTRSKGTIRVVYSGQTYEFPLEECMEQAKALGETGYTVRVLRYFPHATVGPRGTIVNASNHPANPAVEAEITGPKGTTKKLAFARFPTFHGRTGKGFGKDFKLTFKASSSLLASVPIRVYSGPTGELAVQLMAEGSAPVMHVVAAGQTVATPWPGVTFKVLRRFDHAQVHLEATARPRVRETRQPAVLLTATRAATTREIWVEKYRERTIEFDGKAYRVAYGGRSVPLGFQIGLNQFRLGYYPGNTHIRSYESNITITDLAAGGSVDRVISMNRPTTFGGYTFYQASYRKTKNGYATVLSVARDPGAPIVFAGYAITMLGMALLLLRRLKSQRSSLETESARECTG